MSKEELDKELNLILGMLTQMYEEGVTKVSTQDIIAMIEHLKRLNV